MTAVYVLIVLLVAAGSLGCGWALRGARGPQVLAEQVPPAEACDSTYLLASLDLAEIPGAVWCSTSQELRPNATTEQLFASVDASCGGDPTQIPARHVSTGEPVTMADLDRLAAGEAHRMAVWLGADGENVCALEIGARPVQEGSSEVLLVGHDVTAEHSAIQTRGDLVASLSHDMRSALTSTIGYVALVTDDASLSDKHRRSLDIALKGVNQTLHLMADLRAARQPGREDVHLSVEPRECDLVRMLTDALVSLRPVAEERRVSVSVQAPGSASMVADPLRMRQVLDNLLLNAVKHNVEGGWVDIVLTRSKGALRLTVTNTGATLTVAEQKRVFERYYRGEDSRERGVTGAGLGLSVVREIVEQHHGRVTISSSPDLSTTTLRLNLPTTLPVALASEAPSEIESATSEEVHRAARTPTRFDAVAS